MTLVGAAIVAAAVAAAYPSTVALGFGYSGAAGDLTCAGCHTGGLNPAKGSVAIEFPQAGYSGAGKYRVRVTVSDPDARSWGFQLTTRAASAPATKTAGRFLAADSLTETVADGMYVGHSRAGVRSGTQGPVVFEFDWTAPVAGTGEVIFSVAAMASGVVYTKDLRVAEGEETIPVLRAADPALPAFLGKSGFSSNHYLEIYGENLSNGTRVWRGDDFNGANAPTALDGVSVTVNGRPAFVYYISPGQVNVNTPDDDATGPVAVVVTKNGKASGSAMVNKARVAPALLTTPAFLVGGRQYLVAQLPVGGAFVGTPGLISGVLFRAVRPGDTIIVYALGCGPTDPARPAGVTSAGVAGVTLPYELRIGGKKAEVIYFGSAPGNIGLYQINAKVPDVGAGDQTAELVVDGVANGQGLYLSGVVN